MEYLTNLWNNQPNILIGGGLAILVLLGIYIKLLDIYQWKLTRKGIENLSETFNFTPQFGEFVEYTNLFDYINHACGKEKKMKMKIRSINYALIEF